MESREWLYINNSDNTSRYLLTSWGKYLSKIFIILDFPPAHLKFVLISFIFF